MTILDEAYEIIEENYEMLGNISQEDSEKLDDWMERVRQSEFVAVTKQEYEALKLATLHLDILLARGVDNWQGYCFVPDRNDYDSDEEWQEAIRRAEDYLD